MSYILRYIFHCLVASYAAAVDNDNLMIDSFEKSIDNLEIMAVSNPSQVKDIADKLLTSLNGGMTKKGPEVMNLIDNDPECWAAVNEDEFVRRCLSLRERLKELAK